MRYVRLFTTLSLFLRSSALAQHGGMNITAPTLNLTILGSSRGLRNSASCDYRSLLYDGVTPTLCASRAVNSLSLQEESRPNQTSNGPMPWLATRAMRHLNSL
jgi:hypothetical protein